MQTPAEKRTIRGAIECLCGDSAKVHLGAALPFHPQTPVFQNLCVKWDSYLVDSIAVIHRFSCGLGLDLVARRVTRQNNDSRPLPAFVGVHASACS